MAHTDTCNVHGSLVDVGAFFGTTDRYCLDAFELNSHTHSRLQKLFETNDETIYHSLDCSAYTKCQHHDKRYTIASAHTRQAIKMDDILFLRTGIKAQRVRVA